MGWGDGEGAPIHMPMIRLETASTLAEGYVLMVSRLKRLQ